MSERDLEVCVIEKVTGLLFEWNGSQTVNVYDALEYTRKMMTGETPKCFDSYMIGSGMPTNDDKPTAEDFVASVIDHLDLTDGSEDGEE